MSPGRSNQRTSGQRPVRVVAGILVILAAGVLWTALAPKHLGGKAAFVTTFGTSMEPKLHAGDLVLVREAPSYSVGDVVAFRSEKLNTIVLHRIVERVGGRFVTQGDNNSWKDSDLPRPSDIVGKMLTVVPEGGERLRSLRSPTGMAVMLGLGGVTAGARNRRKRRRQEQNGNGSGDDSGSRPTPPRRSAGDPRALIPAVAVTAVVALLLGAVSFTRPEHRKGAREVAFDHRGTFEYTAAAPDAPQVYSDGEVNTGEPVYMKLVSSVDVSYRYLFESHAPIAAAGSSRLVVRLSDVNGWSRSLELQPMTPFSGSEVTVSGTLDLAKLSKLTKEISRLTGIQRDFYTVSVIPEVRLEGTLAGQPLQELFAPPLAFQLDELQFQLQPAGAAAPGTESADPLHPAEGDLLKVPVVEPGVVTFLGMRIPVGALRTIAMILGAAAILGALVITAMARAAAKAGEASRIASRYGQWLIPVSVDDPPAAHRVVEVPAIDGLVRLAEHHGRFILHVEEGEAHTYLVEEGGVTYRYRASSNGAARDLETPAPASNQEIETPTPTADPVTRRRAPRRAPTAKATAGRSSAKAGAGAKPKASTNGGHSKGKASR